MYKLLQDHFVFIVAADVEIKQEFNHHDAPRFPIYIETSLTQLGKSSKTLSYELRHFGTNTLYAKCHVKDVLVSTKTRKPVRYPNWWLEKFSTNSLNVDHKADIFENDIPEVGTFSSTAKVADSDIDTYKHTNWSSYIKFCYDSLHQHVDDQNYETVSRDDLDAGIQSFNMVYNGESSYRDELQIVSWEKESTSTKTVRFNIKNGGTVCFQSDVSFFRKA